MNDLSFKALAFAYLLRGLDKYATDNECPLVGDERHPHYNNGELEALNEIFEEFGGWLDRVTPVDVPLTVFLYQFLENILAPEVYKEDGSVFDNDASLLLKSFTKGLHDSMERPLIHGKPGTGKTGVVDMKSNCDSSYKAVALVYLIRGIDAHAKNHRLPAIGTEEHGRYNEGEHKAIADIENWLSQWMEEAVNVEIDAREFLYEFLEDPIKLPSMIYSGDFTHSVMNYEATNFLKFFVEGSRVNKPATYTVSGYSTNSNETFSIEVVDCDIESAITQAKHTIASGEGSQDRSTVIIYEAVKE